MQRLAGPGFPSCADLNALLPDGVRSAGGHAIRFVASSELENEGYEQRIYTTGQVSTRPHSWHDLFNALVWMRYPLIKSEMNRLHYEAGAGRKSPTRGRLRDALTLFDECGAIVQSDRPDILQALAERRWGDAFLADEFETSVTITLVGHAMLEKCLAPYKAMTANVLLVLVPPESLETSRQQRARRLDLDMAGRLSGGELLRAPGCLSPLPLAGLPGWWPRDAQNDSGFYLDRQVFRPPPANLTPARIHRLG